MVKKNKGEVKPLQSFPPTMKNGWLVKMSILNNSYILLVVQSSRTGEVIVKYCNGEPKAIEFVETLEKIDPSEVYHKFKGERTCSQQFSLY